MLGESCYGATEWKSKKKKKVSLIELIFDVQSFRNMLFSDVVLVAWTWLELVTESGTQSNISTGNYVG